MADMKAYKEKHNRHSTKTKKDRERLSTAVPSIIMIMIM